MNSLFMIVSQHPIISLIIAGIMGFGCISITVIICLVIGLSRHRL